ncbi:MAG: amidohydrolase family protein [Bacillota bacterium]|nr:amidohydrolase family protein [Bacillota bacterium]
MLLKNANYLNNDFNVVHGDIFIENGTISLNEQNINKAEEIIDCSDYWIIPGLFNSHYHGYSLLAKGIVKDMKIEEWNNNSDQGEIQKKFFENLDKITAKEYQVICMKSYIDMVKCGITFVSDSDPGNCPDILAEGICKIGMRGLIDTYGKIKDYENKKIGEITFGTHLLEEEDITDETLASVVQSKRKHNSLFLTHCMENEWRRDLIYSKYEKSSVALYNESGLLDDKTILFHGVYLNEEDIRHISTANASVVHCPVANLWSGAGAIAPVGAMLENDVNVCLGTDFASTNIWETMKIAYLLLKLNNPAYKYTAEHIFKMATRNSAKAYKQNNIGSIQENYKADLVFIKKDKSIPNIEKDHFSTVIHNLIMETTENSVQHVMINGKWVLFDRQLLTIDEEAHNHKYIELLNRIYKNI